MLNTETINELLEIDETYKAPQRMMDILFDSERTKVFDNFLAYESDLKDEWFQSYFENEHSDRKVKKQDFTPQSVSRLLAGIAGRRDSYFEATAGTGGIMIQFWNDNPNAWFHVEELSDRAVPFLLFNMSIRGINGVCFHGDSLSRTAKNVYFIRNEDNERFSEVFEMPKTEMLKAELGIKEFI